MVKINQSHARIGQQIVADVVHIGTINAAIDIAPPIDGIRAEFLKVANAEGSGVDPAKRDAVLQQLDEAKAEAAAPKPDGSKIKRCLEGAKVLIAGIGVAGKLVTSVDKLIESVGGLFG